MGITFIRQWLFHAPGGGRTGLTPWTAPGNASASSKLNRPRIRPLNGLQGAETGVQVLLPTARCRPPRCVGLGLHGGLRPPYPRYTAAITTLQPSQESRIQRHSITNRLYYVTCRTRLAADRLIRATSLGEKLKAIRWAELWGAVARIGSSQRK